MRIFVLVAALLLSGCHEISGLADFTTETQEGDGGGGVGGSGGVPTGSGGGAPNGGGGAGGQSPCPNKVLHLTETTTDWAEVPDDPAFDGLNAFTVEAWIRVDNAIGMEESHIIAHNDHLVGGWVLMVLGGQIEFRIYDPNWRGDRGPTVPLEQWTHVAATFDGSTMVTFVNGVASSGTSANTPSECDHPLRLGRAAYDDVFPFLGKIDDVRISSGALYPSDFDVPTAQLEPDDDTIALWRFQDSGLTIVDDAADHDGTIQRELREEDDCPLMVGE